MRSAKRERGGTEDDLVEMNKERGSVRVLPDWEGQKRQMH